jgi:hypothetical protein
LGDWEHLISHENAITCILTIGFAIEIRAQQSRFPLTYFAVAGQKFRHRKNISFFFAQSSHKTGNRFIPTEVQFFWI